MNTKIFSEALGNVSDDYVIQAAGYVPAGRGWIKWATAAACLCLLAAGMLLWRRPVRPQEQDGPSIILSEEGVTIPKMKVSLSASDGQEADMVGFFIYQGSCYVFYDWIYDEVDIIGKRLGSATGMIDEWTPADGYVELAGSVKGDFYEVKGYDPSFMLCMREQNGAIGLYIRSTGLTIKYGSELYEDRLHLSENYDMVQYESRDSWYRSKEERYRLEGNDDLIRQFLEGLNAAEFIPQDSVPLREGAYSLFDEMEIFHLYFRMKDGTFVHLRLLRDGYVFYQGMMNVCVQVPEESYDRLIEVLRSYRSASPAEVPKYRRTLEDCAGDPELGRYIPAYAPDNMTVQSANILYYLEPEHAGKTGTKEIRLEYCAADASRPYYGITVTWAAEYGRNGWAGPMLKESELSLEKISEYIQTKNSGDEELPVDQYRLGLGVWHDNVSVVISARGLDAETIYRILESIRAE